MSERHCHYCGSVYSDASGDASAALQDHLLRDCRAVPAVIREQYRRNCAFENCNG